MITFLISNVSLIICVGKERVIWDGHSDFMALTLCILINYPIRFDTLSLG